MIAVEDYLAQVRRAMRGMDEAVRTDILQELKGHLDESIAANGGDVKASIAAVGRAADVGRHYRDVYGYGRRYRLAFAAVAGLLAVPSVPVLVIGPENILPFSLSIPFLIGTAAWILWVSSAAGSRAGVVAGLAALIGRSAAFGVSAFVQAGGIVSPLGLAAFIAASAVLLILGWLPGTARKAWTRPQAEL